MGGCAILKVRARLWVSGLDGDVQAGAGQEQVGGQANHREEIRGKYLSTAPSEQREFENAQSSLAVLLQARTPRFSEYRE